MKLKSKTSGSFRVLGCLMLGIALMFGAMLSGNSKVVFAAETDGQLPAIVSVAGIPIGEGNMGGFPSAIVGEEYKAPNGENYRVAATGSGTLTYSANEYASGGYGEMPEGLHLNSQTGEFSGTITSQGEFNVFITVSNEYSSANALCRIKVFNATDKPTITTESLSNGAVGSFYSQKIIYSGYSAMSPTCEVVNGNLPTGLSFGIQYGDPTIYGTPTETGTFTFTLSVNNGAGTATKEYTLEIKEENVAPSLTESATTIKEEDKFSFIDSSGYIHVVKGKSVNIQLVASGTNTTDNPIKFTLTGKLPEGLTLSESGVISGTPADSIETEYGQKYYYGIGFKLENKKQNGDTQSSQPNITIVVHDNGYVQNMKLNPETTSVARGGTRQFAIEWTGYGDVDKTVTWKFAGSSMPSSEETTISNTGLLTIGLDEERNVIYVTAEHSSGKSGDATVTVIDHTHQTELVAKVDKTCETDGCDKHYKCKICDGVFKDALATESTTLEALKIAKGHEYGDIVPKQDATCSSTGKKAHYKCSVCNKLFDSDKVETTDDALVIAKDETKHKFGTLQTEKPANCATEGTKAHKDCEYCHKHFDNDGTEITDLTIARNEEHLKQTEWSKDSTGHWYACTREGCKDGGKINFSVHNPSATESTETTDVHCTECKYVIKTVKEHTHGLVTVYGTAKGCYIDGSKTYWVCSNGEHPCGHYFEDEAGKIKIEEDINTWKRIPAEHEFGEWQAEVPATVDEFGVKAHKDCTVCHKHFDVDGLEIGDLTIPKLESPTDPDTPVTPTDPTTPDTPVTPDDPTTPSEPTDSTDPITPSDEQKDGLSGGAIAGIVIGSVAVAGIGGFALVWFVIKKKKWADLVAVFKNLFAKK